MTETELKAWAEWARVASFRSKLNEVAAAILALAESEKEAREAVDSIRATLSGLDVSLGHRAEHVARAAEVVRARLEAAEAKPAEAKREVERRVRAYAVEPGQLQEKWRSEKGLRERDSIELDVAILDALVIMGGATAWVGDGSSCAAQIVRNVLAERDAAREELAEQAQATAKARAMAHAADEDAAEARLGREQAEKHIRELEAKLAEARGKVRVLYQDRDALLNGIAGRDTLEAAIIQARLDADDAAGRNLKRAETAEAKLAEVERDWRDTSKAAVQAAQERDKEREARRDAESREKAAREALLATARRAKAIDGQPCWCAEDPGQFPPEEAIPHSEGCQRARDVLAPNAAKPCECRCGYRCGGPGRCTLGVFECLNTGDGKHFVRDCDHDFTGPWVEHRLPEGGSMGSVTCRKCKMTAIGHDMRVGP